MEDSGSFITGELFGGVSSSRSSSESMTWVYIVAFAALLLLALPLLLQGFGDYSKRSL
jgi:hypothetical protein